MLKEQRQETFLLVLRYWISLVMVIEDSNGTIKIGKYTIISAKQSLRVYISESGRTRILLRIV